MASVVGQRPAPRPVTVCTPPPMPWISRAFHSRLNRPKRLLSFTTSKGNLAVHVAGISCGVGNLSQSLSVPGSFLRASRDSLIKDLDVDHVGFDSPGVAAQDAELTCSITPGQVLTRIGFREAVSWAPAIDSASVAPAAQAASTTLQVPFNTAVTFAIVPPAAARSTVSSMGVPPPTAAV
jgi:hypothetical protein